MDGDGEAITKEPPSSVAAAAAASASHAMTVPSTPNVFASLIGGRAHEDEDFDGAYEELGPGSQYTQMQGLPTTAGSPPRMLLEEDPIFKEPPVATVVSVTRSEGTSFQLIYTIDFEYRQFKWRLVKKATQVFSLHSAIKIRALVEDLHEKQEQAREWFQNLGIGDHAGINLHVQEDDEQDENPTANRKDIPSSAALPVMRPALGRLPTITYRAQTAMQDYIKHFLDDLDIVNTREVCRFLEVSKLSFAPEYGPKLHEGYVMVQHLPIISKDESTGCLGCFRSCCCCNPTWQKVWAVLKPGFLAILGDPFDAKPLDIIVFDVLPPLDRGATEGLIALARLNKERNPLRFSFTVTCGTRTVRIRTQRAGRAKDWVASINDAGLRPPEGWCHPHRFGSFAPPRGFSDGSEAQWFIDGKAAFEAIAGAIENARSEIFIAGWWLCPDLYLRRPYGSNEASRLDHLLEAKAKMGVQIFILLYKEVALALKINSNYSKQRLLGLHENIKVLRFPDHFSSGVYLWSHHEKLVIVDHHICFLGGLDLCFGRYDTPDHRVSDHPSTIWPGKDYYNPRESEPNSWEDTMKDELDRRKIPRMPWHDVHCALWGPPCRDVARHFVQRWNYAKRSKAPNEHAIPLLLPQHHMVIPHYLTGRESLENKLQEQQPAQEEMTSARSSYSDIPLLLPKETEQDEVIQDIDNAGNESTEIARHPSISSSEIVHVARHASSELVRGIQRALIGLSPLRSPVHSNSVPNDEERALLSDVPMQAFVGDPVVDDESRSKSTGSVRPKRHARTRKVSRSEWWDVDEHELGGFDAVGEVGPQTSCRCQVIRSVGQWSAGTSQAEERSIHEAYCSLIDKAEYFVYIENQFFISGLEGDDTIHNRVLQALYSRIMRAYKEGRCFRVIVLLPLLPGFQGGVDDGGAASVRAIMHWQYRTICRGKNSLLERLSCELGEQAHDYISFYGLRSHGKLHESGPLATSQIYVHSKIMIVDDWAVLIGSANINDRSLLGSRDSELAVVLEDNQFIRSRMNGKVWNAGRFAHSLRVSLWAEHLGLRTTEVDAIRDPVCDTTYKDLWMSRAKTNSRIYKDVFGSIPDDAIPSRIILRQAISLRKDKFSHNTIDLGIAPASNKPNEATTDDRAFDPDHCTDGIIGHLVFFALGFMAEEDLRPVFKESEYYASAQIFH
ncbi:phospholipase D zeta 1 [Physcomitrium patens]|uniref:Phospholipase n=1 Tax=Physcomitrium patens TaxID=3218 RepID=A0A7I4F221_PHYPA|nr:phospholipase D zeta 1-like [Physcomitrium patens]|eukprot:XP_024390954.1 phospholipase D zeta 1-like [Physcomitrella patens]